MSMLVSCRTAASAVVTFNRPPANAMTRDFFREVEQLRPRCRHRRRAPSYHRHRRFFSAGLDLFGSSRTAALTSATSRLASTPPSGLFGLGKPVVAAVNGHAVAGGAAFACCADFRVMADGDGRVGLTEIQVGLLFPVSVLEIVRYACAGRI